MTKLEIDNFIIECNTANILIPNGIIAIYDNLYNEVPEMKHLTEIEYNSLIGIRIYVVDKDKYINFIKIE